MNSKLIKSFLAITLGEVLLALVWVVLMPAPVNRTRTLHLPLMQGIVVTMIVLLALVDVLILLRFFRDQVWGNRVTAALDRWLTTEARVLIVKDFIVVGLIFALEWFLLTYLSLPVAFQPLIFWTGLVCAQAWMFLLHAYRDIFRSRPGGWRALRTKWLGLEPVQRKTIKILVAIAVIYFGVFAFINWHGISEHADTFFAGAGDEVVLYPVAYEMVSPASDLAGQVYRFLIHEDYHYGYPYFYFSALLLAGSRLVFGLDFINHTQVNLFLLRQVISVLPMLLAVFVLVSIVTQFKPVWYAVIMFVVMLLIPGLVRYNQQFWHPDAIMLLFIALTFYYLQRDRLRFGRDFYYAAIMCGLAAATKLYGFFFFLTIAGYLFAGLLKKYLTYKTMFLAGVGFVLAMGLAILYASPFLLVPSAQKSLVAIMSGKTAEMSQGYAEPDPEGVYVKGLGNWLKYFAFYYGKPYFFYGAFAALLLGAGWGGDKYLFRLFLAWGIVLAGYLIYLIAVKSYHYMLPLALPLYAGVFALPRLLQETDQPSVPWLLENPILKWVVWGATAALIGSQFLFNVWDIFTSPYVRVFF